MNWHFPFFLVATVTLPSVCSQFNPLSLEELGSDTGIQVFNQIVKSRPHDNIVISPHGIASVLGMLQLGADGRTKKQLTTVMRYGVNGACAQGNWRESRIGRVLWPLLPAQRRRAAGGFWLVPPGSQENGVLVFVL